MLFKKDILEMIMDANITLTETTKSVYDLECKVAALEKTVKKLSPKTCKCPKKCEAKRRPGRPKKS